MKHEKTLLLDEIRDQIQDTPSYLIAQYAKLSANKANDFRRQMAKIGVNFEVVRKRVLVKAAQMPEFRYLLIHYQVILA